MMKAIRLITGVLFACSLAAPGFAVESGEHWEYRRSISVPVADGKLIAVPLDAHVQGHSQPGLDDLRVSAANAGFIPYFIYEQMEESRTRQPIRTEVIAKEMNETRSLASVDMGTEADFNRIALKVQPKNFIRAIDIEGSLDGVNWRPIRQGIVVYSLKQPYSASYLYRYFGESFTESMTGYWNAERLEVDVPPSHYRYVRVLMPHDLDKEPVALDGVAIYRNENTPALEDRFVGTIQKKEAVEEGKAFEYTVDLGTAVPISRIEIETSAQNFFRRASVDSSEDLVAWSNRAETSVFSISHGGNSADSRSFSFNEVKARYWKVRLWHDDNEPIVVTGVTGHGLRRYAVFVPKAAGDYELWYGHAGAKKPQYDIQNVFRGSRFQDFSEVSPEAPQRHAGFKPWIEEKPWTETKPALLWIAMAGVLGGLLMLAFQQVKKVGSK